MRKFIVERANQGTAAALDVARGRSRYGAFIGLDVHKDTIAIAVAVPGACFNDHNGE